MLPANVDFPCQRGQTFHFRFGLRDSSDPVQLYDITGMDFIVQFRQPMKTTVMADWTLSLLNGTLTYDAGTGILSGKISESLTAALPMNIGHLDYVVIAVNSDGTDDRLMQGRVPLSKDKWQA